MMNNKLKAFLSLANIFKENGYSLFLVGGSVRDYLLNKELLDMDVTSDATPREIKTFFKGEANYTFEKFGAVNIKHDGVKFDLTTLREENTYLDYRHPDKVKFVKDLVLDYPRRDFTINGMYMDSDFKIYDFGSGQIDLKNKIIKFIGDADRRIKEDPLRILRAIRFSLLLSFEIDKESKRAILDNISLLEKLNIDKIKQELSKMKNVKDEEKISLFNEFGIQYLLSVVK